MPADALETVEVHLASHHRPEAGLSGPLLARRLGEVLVYEMQAPEQFEPWPGRSRVERKYALLDLGVSFGIGGDALVHGFTISSDRVRGS